MISSEYFPAKNGLAYSFRNEFRILKWTDQIFVPFVTSKWQLKRDICPISKAHVQLLLTSCYNIFQFTIERFSSSAKASKTNTHKMALSLYVSLSQSFAKPPMLQTQNSLSQYRIHFSPSLSHILSLIHCLVSLIVSLFLSILPKTYYRVISFASN